MKELELLGLQNDGEHLTLNDAEGNRYTLEITSELRAALRHDVTYTPDKDAQARPVSPREIQAYVRSGKTIEEISELTSIPPSRIESLAHPIINERNYTARLARSLPTTSDPGSLTLEELVATRLASRGVKSDSITWDAIRESGEPWTVIATYESAERERQAVWHVDISKRSLEAISEEAIWLSETPLLPHGDAWRAPNTPPLTKEKSTSVTPLSSLPSAPSSSSASTPDTSSSRHDASVSRIDAVLADLDARRGVPTDKEHYSSLLEANAAKELESADSADAPRGDDSENQRETIFDLPVHSNIEEDTGNSADSETDGSNSASQDNNSEHNSPLAEDLFSSAASADVSAAGESPQDRSQTQKKVRRSDRPSMPTWDEIVFGKKN